MRATGRQVLEIDRVAADGDLAARALALGVPVRALEHALDAQQQLSQVERLDHVVVGADLQPVDPILFGGARGEDEDRQFLVSQADLARDLEAVDLLLDHDVQDEQVERVGLLQPERLLPARGP